MTSADNCTYELNITDRNSIFNLLAYYNCTGEVAAQNSIWVCNISLLVATCEEICPVVYGTGNPDISGIGAMISYIIQTGVTFIFGPLLALLCVIYGIDLADSSFTEPNKPYSKLLRSSINLSRSAQMANSLTTLSVLIASLIRIQQLPPVAELTFIKILSLYQWLVSIGISASYWSVFGENSVQYSLLRFYIIVVFGSYIAVVFTNGYSSFDVDILDSITWHCVADWHYPAPDLRASSDDNGIGNMTIASWPTYLLLAALSYLVLVFIILYFEEWLEKVYNIFRYKVFALCKRLGADPKKLLSSLCIVFVTALWTFGTTWTLRDLQLQRQQLQLVSGNAYQDSQWGFGQVTAMFLWGPMCGDIFLITFEYFQTRTSLRCSSVDRGKRDVKT